MKFPAFPIASSCQVRTRSSRSTRARTSPQQQQQQQPRRSRRDQDQDQGRRRRPALEPARSRHRPRARPRARPRSLRGASERASGRREEVGSTWIAHHRRPNQGTQSKAKQSKALAKPFRETGDRARARRSSSSSSSSSRRRSSSSSSSGEKMRQGVRSGVALAKAGARRQAWAAGGRRSLASSSSSSGAASDVDIDNIPHHKLEAVLGDALLAAQTRKKKLLGDAPGLPVTGPEFDAAAFYEQVQGANCENVVGFLPIPVGVVGPLEVNGKSHYVPMATTEGALLASTNRGARAIREAGGAKARVVREGMTRSPVLGFNSTMEAADFAAWIKEPETLQKLKDIFATTTSFGKLTSVTPTVAGRYCYLRFEAQTGDAMGMNMVGKGTNRIVEELVQTSSAKLISLSSNMCTDKKPSALNWTQGRGKSVVCEVVLSAEIVEKVLKTNIADLAQLSITKNLVGSSLAGSIGGNNAHAANVVTAIYLATGQDPAQNVESSNCMVLFEPIDEGKNLHVSVTMPSIEVGTVGGGTTLPAQRQNLEVLGVAGADRENPGGNARSLAEIVAASVLAGELSLNAALSSNALISAHLALNRK